MKYVQKTSWEGTFMCAIQVFLCALISRPVFMQKHAQLRGNIGRGC